MIESTEKSKYFGPIIWDEYGRMLLLDGKNQYWYGAVYDWKYKKIREWSRRGYKGRVYQYLKKNCTFLFKVEDSHGYNDYRL